MKKLLVIGAVAVLVVVSLGAAGFVYAQSGTPTPTPGNGYGPGMMGWGGGHGPGMMGGGFGFGRGMWGGVRPGGTGPMHTYMVAALAEALGLDAEELQTRLEAGDSPWTIAQEQGRSDEEIRELMITAHSEALTAAVAAGALTQEQANWMLERMSSMQASGFGPGACHGTNGAPGSAGRGSGWKWNNPEGG